MSGKLQVIVPKNEIKRCTNRFLYDIIHRNVKLGVVWVSIKVSVIVPTHNRPHFLGRTIDSLLAQTYRNTEIVVVDDNATDKLSPLVDDKAVVYNCAHFLLLFLRIFTE